MSNDFTKRLQMIISELQQLELEVSAMGESAMTEGEYTNIKMLAKSLFQAYDFLERRTLPEMNWLGGKNNVQ